MMPLIWVCGLSYPYDSVSNVDVESSGGVIDVAQDDVAVSIKFHSLDVKVQLLGNQLCHFNSEDSST